jgi:hypothetical protein
MHGLAEFHRSSVEIAMADITSFQVVSSGGDETLVHRIF